MDSAVFLPVPANPFSFPPPLSPFYLHLLQVLFLYPVAFTVFTPPQTRQDLFHLQDPISPHPFHESPTFALSPTSAGGNQWAVNH